MQPLEGNRRFSPDSSAESGQEREPVSVIRIIPLTFKSVQELRDELSMGTPIDEIELSRVVLTLKSRESETSYGLMMPLGGKMESGETSLQAARRKLRDESLLYPMGGRWWEVQPLFQPIEGSYVYRVLGREETTRRPENPRAVSFLPYPVLPPEYTRMDPRNKASAKIASLESFAPWEFRELVERGELTHLKDETGPLGDLFDPFSTIDVAGSITKVEKYDIDIDRDEQEKKNVVLDELLDRVDEYEIDTRNAVLSEVNEERRHHQRRLASLLRECGEEEIVRAFQRVHIFWLLRDERARESSQEKKPPPGMDLLKFAWFLSGEGIEISEINPLVFGGPTENIRENLKTLTLSLRRAMVEAERADFTKQFPEAVPPRAADIRRSLTIDGLRTRFSELSPVERAAYIRRLDEVAMRIYARRKGISVDELKQVKVEVDQFFPTLVEQGMQAHPRFERMFHPSKVLNEIANARLVRLILLANNLNPYTPQESISDGRLRRQLVFEAARHLAFIGHGVHAYERYRELLTSGNEPIEAVLNGEVFSLPEHEERRESGGSVYTVTHRTTRFPVGGEQRHIVIDERAPKTFGSFLHKSFLEPLDEIYDVFSRNIIFTEEGSVLENRDREDRLTLGEFRKLAEKRISETVELRNEMKLRFSRLCTEAGWTVDFIGEKDTFSRLKKSPSALRREEASGKRPGSKGVNIIRTKLYCVLHDPEGREYAEEIIIYPFDNFQGTPYAEVLWGHKEKIEDDATGGYKFRRITEPEQGYPDLPSMFVLWFPPHIYELYAEALYFDEEDAGRSR